MPNKTKGDASLMSEKSINLQDRSEKTKERPIICRVSHCLRDEHEKYIIDPHHQSNRDQGEEMNPSLKCMDDKKMMFLIDICKRATKDESITKEKVLKTHY